MADDQQLSLLEVFNRKHCSLSIASLKQDTSGATPYPLGVGEATAGERSAILYTIIENCRRRGLDPFAYLKDAFTRLPTMTNRQVKDITPKAWAKQRHSPVLKAAA